MCRCESCKNGNCDSDQDEEESDGFYNEFDEFIDDKYMKNMNRSKRLKKYSVDETEQKIDTEEYTPEKFHELE